MRKSLALALILPALALPFAGCGSGAGIPTPPACLTTPEIWMTALAEAPDQVLIEGDSKISECLPADQTAAQQEEVGRTAVEVASRLATFTKASGKDGDYESSVEAALMAGYLVGALEKAAEESEGIHATLVSRVEAAATNGLQGASPKIRRTYEKGYEAGRETG